MAAELATQKLPLSHVDSAQMPSPVSSAYSAGLIARVDYPSISVLHLKLIKNLLAIPLKD